MGLAKIVEIYIQKFRPHAQGELEFFRSLPSLKKAIQKAALAINSEGKRYSHQRRLSRRVLEEAHRIILKKAPTIREVETFDNLHDLIGSSVRAINGIGPLYIYDTSLRIGAKLDLLPEKIYLHAGTREGAKALGFDNRSHSLDLDKLPPELQVLEPHEIEDLLCIFKDELKRKDSIGIDEEYIKRSRHC